MNRILKNIVVGIVAMAFCLLLTLLLKRDGTVNKADIVFAYFTTKDLAIASVVGVVIAIQRTLKGNR